MGNGLLRDTHARIRRCNQRTHGGVVPGTSISVTSVEQAMTSDSRIGVHPFTHTEKRLIDRAKAWKRMKLASAHAKIASMKGDTRAEIHYLDLWSRYRRIAMGYVGNVR